VLHADSAYDRGGMQPIDPVLFYKALGDLIRRKRKRLGLTQKKLAERLSVSRASIANIETGRQKILIHQLFQLAAALDIAAEDLLLAAAGEATNLLAAAGEATNKDLGHLPLPKDLSLRQKAQISRLLSDRKPTTSRDDSKE
jgi:transcriptional regulator with XRE-family HTH domain